jgi:alpha-tubulin suppressor-like RCC1 family protein
MPGREEVLTFGWNDHGICGTGNETNVHSPCTILKGWRIGIIGAGVLQYNMVTRTIVHNKCSYKISTSALTTLIYFKYSLLVAC